jgi:hypothetical protein
MLKGYWVSSSYVVETVGVEVGLFAFALVRAFVLDLHLGLVREVVHRVDQVREQQTHLHAAQSGKLCCFLEQAVFSLAESDLLTRDYRSLFFIFDKFDFNFFSSHSKNVSSLLVGIFMLLLSRLEM